LTPKQAAHSKALLKAYEGEMQEALKMNYVLEHPKNYQKWQIGNTKFAFDVTFGVAKEMFKDFEKKFNEAKKTYKLDGPLPKVGDYVINDNPFDDEE
jgi:hypothetical protein